MSIPTSRQLLRRHAFPFALAFVGLTAGLVANYASKRTWGPSRATFEGVMLAIPFTAAMTIPMAVLLAVLTVFAQLRREGVLDAMLREPNGIRRLITPVLGAAAIIATLAFILNTQVLPKANERLATLSAGQSHVRSDREMTISQLRTEANKARAATGDDATALASRYEVEIQKKYAIAAAAFVLALTAVAIVFLFPRGGVVLFASTGVAVVVLYYFALVAGEFLADHLVLSPVIAMWMANGFFLAFALLVLRSRALKGRQQPDALSFGA